jgi:YbbR domain-containing protein
MILKNKALKFFSLLLAISLWFFVMGEKEAEFSFSDLPLVLINKPDDLIITQQTADRISLRVGGSRTILAALSSSSIEATVNLEGIKPGTTRVKDLVGKVKLPNGTKITSISPAEFSLTLEPVATKKVPVRLTMEGKPGEGYEISSISIKPEFVEVRLAKSEAKDLEKVMTRPLDISGAKGDIEKEIALDLTGLDPPRSVSSKEVKASVLISEKIIEETLSNIAVEVVNTSYQTEVTPSTFKLTIKGSYHLVKKLSESGLSAPIDLQGVKPGKYSKKAEIKLPEGVTVVEDKPLWVKIDVRKELLKK